MSLHFCYCQLVFSFPVIIIFFTELNGKKTLNQLRSRWEDAIIFIMMLRTNRKNKPVYICNVLRQCIFSYSSELIWIYESEDNYKNSLQVWINIVSKIITLDIINRANFHLINMDAPNTNDTKRTDLSCKIQTSDLE